MRCRLVPLQHISHQANRRRHLFIRAHKGKITIHTSQCTTANTTHVLSTHSVPTHSHLPGEGTRAAPYLQITLTHNWALTYHGGLWRYFERCEHGHIHQSNHSSHYTKGPEQPLIRCLISAPAPPPTPSYHLPTFAKNSITLQRPPCFNSSKLGRATPSQGRLRAASCLC